VGTTNERFAESPETRGAVPTAVPSRENVTVPVGRVAPAAVMVAVACRGFPAVGVVVPGVTTSEVGNLATARATAGAVEPLK
jgi:hypothetical protein